MIVNHQFTVNDGQWYPTSDECLAKLPSNLVPSPTPVMTSRDQPCLISAQEEELQPFRTPGASAQLMKCQSWWMEWLMMVHGGWNQWYNSWWMVLSMNGWIMVHYNGSSTIPWLPLSALLEWLMMVNQLFTDGWWMINDVVMVNHSSTTITSWFLGVDQLVDWLTSDELKLFNH